MQFTESYNAFNVHKTEAQAQIAKQKKMSHLCEIKSRLALRQRIWPSIPHGRITSFLATYLEVKQK